MATKTKVCASRPQVWECPICHEVYKSPIAIREVLCPRTHVAKKGRSGKALMVLQNP